MSSFQFHKVGYLFNLLYIIAVTRHDESYMISHFSPFLDGGLFSVRT